MTARKKGYGNAVLDACADSIKKETAISCQKSAQWSIATKARRKVEELDREARAYHIVLCKEIAEEILSRDLRLDEIDYDFLKMPLPKNDAKEETVSLLEGLIRRNRHNDKFTYIDPYQKMLASKVQRIIGFENDRKTFFRNLNKKFDGILKFKVSGFEYDPLYLKTLKSPPQEKIAIEIEFVSQYS